MTVGKPSPGRAKKGAIDTRSSSANAKQADEVKPHPQKAADKPAERTNRAGEAAGAMKDQTAR